VQGRVLLLGDAAHAIVPFHGQGMNCAFEDCVMLYALVGAGGAGVPDWPAVFGEFERRRRADTEAIARMALENYAEMRDTVRDESFLRRKALELALERRHPQRFIPRYSMVMFHALEVFGVPDPFSVPISLNRRAEVGGVPTLISNVFVLGSMMTLTGTFMPTNPFVFSLIFATTWTTFTPMGPRAGPRGGPGEAFPPSTSTSIVSTIESLLLP
jgi:hypothetical protein